MRRIHSRQVVIVLAAAVLAVCVGVGAAFATMAKSEPVFAATHCTHYSGTYSIRGHAASARD